MPRKNYEILESAEELPDMIKNEKRGRFRDRLRMLWFLKTGEAKTMTRAAELCGISCLTAAEWFRRYETGGIAELLCIRTVPGRQRAISGDVLEDSEKRLSEPEGFGSYGETEIWLMETMILIFLIKLSIKLSDITSEPSRNLRVLRMSEKVRKKYANSKNLFRL